jgi:hypothetical protein
MTATPPVSTAAPSSSGAATKSQVSSPASSPAPTETASQRKASRWHRESKPLLEDFVLSAKLRVAAFNPAIALCDQYPNIYFSYVAWFKFVHQDIAKAILATATLTCDLQHECLVMLGHVPKAGPISKTGADKRRTKHEVADLCIFAAGFSHYGIDSLARLSASKLFNTVKKIPLHSHELRNAAPHNRLRAMFDDAYGMDAAHYIGLDVLVIANMMQMPGQHVDVDGLRFFGNVVENMKMCPARENRGLHKRVDNAIVKWLTHEAVSPDFFSPGTAERDRLEEIVACIQSDKMQEHVLKMDNGVFLYNALKECFHSLCPDVWDAKNDRGDPPVTLSTAADTDGSEDADAQLSKEAERKALLLSLLELQDGVEMPKEQKGVETSEEQPSTKHSADPASPRDSKRDLQVGPRGGVFYINGNDNKNYLPKESAERKRLEKDHPELFSKARAAATAA